MKLFPFVSIFVCYTIKIKCLSSSDLLSSEICHAIFILIIGCAMFKFYLKKILLLFSVLQEKTKHVESFCHLFEVRLKLRWKRYQLSTCLFTSVLCNIFLNTCHLWLDRWPFSASCRIIDKTTTYSNWAERNRVTNFKYRFLSRKVNLLIFFWT